MKRLKMKRSRRGRRSGARDEGWWESDSGERKKLPGGEEP